MNDCARSNASIAEMLDNEPSELTGMDGLELVAPDCQDDVAEDAASGYESPHATAMARKDGSHRLVELQGGTMKDRGRSFP